MIQKLLARGRRLCSALAREPGPMPEPIRGPMRPTVEVGPPTATGRRLAACDDWLALALKYPRQAHEQMIRAARSQFGPEVDPARDLTLFYDRERYPIPHDRLWNTPAEKVIRQTAADLIALLDRFAPDEVGRHTIHAGREFYSRYLYMNAVRVLNLHDALLRKGFSHGSVLEVGSYFGSFALALQRLGYRVTAVDRYRSYGSAFDAYTDLMSREGVTVVATDRPDERSVIGSLPTFDCVLSAAVIEHIPHTPREFLGLLADRCRPGGLVALDTPNLARWWNRQRLSRGESIFQDLTQQFYCEIPYEGHHREYTAGELEWMLAQVGCADVESVSFDYNLLQFPVIDRPHITCLLNLLLDPALADTILVCGRLHEVPQGLPPLALDERPVGAEEGIGCL